MQEDGEEVVEAGLVAERGPQGGWGGEVMGVVKGEADVAVEGKVVVVVGWGAVAMVVVGVGVRVGVDPGEVVVRVGVDPGEAVVGMGVEGWEVVVMGVG